MRNRDDQKEHQGNLWRLKQNTTSVRGGSLILSRALLHLTKKVVFKSLTRWIYTLQYTLPQPNTCMLLGYGYRDWKTRKRAEARGLCLHEQFLCVQAPPLDPSFFCKEMPRNVKGWKKNKREAISSNIEEEKDYAFFSLKKAKLKEIKWDAKMLDFSRKAGRGRVQVMWHHWLFSPWA